jgi:hypothetical protein
MCWLANYRGEVPSSEEISLVDSIIVDWFMVLVIEVSTLRLNLLTTQTMVTTGILPCEENSHGRAGNRTRDLVVSCQKLWPPDHEAGHVILLWWRKQTQHTFNYRIIMASFWYITQRNTHEHCSEQAWQTGSHRTAGGTFELFWAALGQNNPKYGEKIYVLYK